MRRLALNCTDDRPVWSMPRSAADRIADRLGEGWEVVNVETPASSRGDGGSISSDATQAAQDSEIYIGAGVPKEVLAAGGTSLRWAHTTAAGVSSFLYPEMIASPVILTNAAGVHAEPMAESVLAMMLYFARGFDYAVAAQRQTAWDQQPFIGSDSYIHELTGTTVAILGLGGIGRAVQRRASALGMRVVGLISKSTDAELHDALRTCDYLVICVPDTERTRGLIGKRELGLMKRSSVLINVARGSVVDEDALAEALASNRVRGAGLDVFRKEPLPSDSPLWALPNVLVTPHVSAVTRRYWDRQLDLILDNITRYLQGEPLRNVVDKQQGY